MPHLTGLLRPGGLTPDIATPIREEVERREIRTEKERQIKRQERIDVGAEEERALGIEVTEEELGSLREDKRIRSLALGAQEFLNIAVTPEGTADIDKTIKFTDERLQNLISEGRDTTETSQLRAAAVKARETNDPSLLQSFVEGARSDVQMATQIGILKDIEDPELKIREQDLAERTLELKEREFTQKVEEFESASGTGLDPKQLFDIEKGMRGEFISQSKEFVQQRDSFARLLASADDPSAAGDLSLIFNFMKILDPGSVVRESEFATAQNAPGVPERIRAQKNRILEGERFTPDSRQDFVDRGEKLFAKAQLQHQKRIGVFTDLAVRKKIDPQNIVIDLTLAEEQAQEETREFTSIEEAEAANLPIGTEITINGRRAVIE